EVLPAAELVGNPLAGLSAVVQIEDGGDAVDADTVDVIAVEPEHRVRDQEALDLLAAKVEDVALPLRVEAPPRVGVLVEVGAVEVRQAMLVGWKVRGHPVQNHADALLVELVDKLHQVLGRAVAAGGREVARGLVAPGAEERV